jgi:predicted Zn-dependent protease
MKFQGLIFAVCCFAATALSLPLASCNSAESRAQDAFNEYQAASAAGDRFAARRALLQAVAAKDDKAAYWDALGKLQLELGAYPDAYYAFTRAHELDKSNVSILAALTHLSLAAGKIDVAEGHAEQLQLFAPDHPAVRMAFGYAALKRSDLDEADRQVNQLLADLPYDPNTKLLKARILVAQGERRKAVDLLEEQVRAKPDDVGAFKALAAMHRRESDWPGVMAAASRAYRLDPKDGEAGLMAIDAAFKANDIPAAMRASEPFLSPQAAPGRVDAALEVWAKRWKSPEAIALARKLARAAPVQHRLAWATYFNEAGSPADAAALAGGKPKLPLNRANISANAILADSLARSGRTAQAKQLFDAILAKEPDHVYALRGRINLEIGQGQAKAAISDAQRLVSIVPGSARDRLLLANAYLAARDMRQMDRILWDAFHEIPANVDVYEALRAHVQRTRGPDAARSVDAEFDQQRDVELRRELT